MRKFTYKWVNTANTRIREESGELYVDFNRITTVNFDGVTRNLSMFASDKVHPLPKTHELMTERALLDIPEVFNFSEGYGDHGKNFGGV